jgi:hypothetical protein
MITKFFSSYKRSFNDKDDDDHISHIIVVFWLVPSSWMLFTPPYIFLPVCFKHARKWECILSFNFNKCCVNLYFQCTTILHILYVK